MLNKQPLPYSRHVIPLFIMHLHEKNLQVSSIRNNLSAIAFTHKIHDYGDPTKSFKITKLLDALKMSTSCRKRLPITLPVLRRIVENCLHIAADKYENRLYKCIFLLMYHACLHVGEVTASQHCLMASQIKIKDENLCITFHSFRHSKNRSVKITIPRTHDKFCPVNAYQSYARIRGSAPGPTFLTKDHKAVRLNKIASVLLARATGSVKGIAYFTWAMGREWLIFQNVWRELEYFIVLWNDSQLRQHVRNCENIVRECCFQLHRCIFQYFCALAQ